MRSSPVTDDVLVFIRDADRIGITHAEAFSRFVPGFFSDKLERGIMPDPSDLIAARRLCSELKLRKNKRVMRLLTETEDRLWARKEGQCRRR